VSSERLLDIGFSRIVQKYLSPRCAKKFAVNWIKREFFHVAIAKKANNFGLSALAQALRNA
jgi:hypothetical protein